jgi:hypothetical protein
VIWQKIVAWTQVVSKAQTENMNVIAYRVSQKLSTENEATNALSVFW